MMATATRERGILFSGPMVRAILEGRKTQTRRVVKPQPGDHPNDDGYNILVRCPYGQPGDRLWVRETWAAVGYARCWDGLKPSEIPEDGTVIVYRADDPVPKDDDGEWRPSIHMPRWASRLSLPLVAVRVEPLQEISEEDVQAEGCTGSPLGHAADKALFPSFWDQINRERAPWESNPWVWVLDFERES